VQVLWRTGDGPATVDVEAAGSSASLVDPLGFTAAPNRTDAGWEVALPPTRTAQPSDPPGFQSVGYPIMLVESGIPSGPRVAAPRVTSPLLALVPATVEAPAALPVAVQPGSGGPAQPTPAAAPPPLVLQPALTQPGTSLVLSVGNPQPGDLLPRGKVVMQGQAFDRAATTGSGVDRVSVFLDNRDSGGQHIGDAVLGQPGATGFTVTADLSRASGGHTLFVYARSAVSGTETVVSFPVAVGNR
jgi:hypothetical protein